MFANPLPTLLQHVRCLARAQLSDEQLLADFLARRSDEAFSALVSRHGPMVLNVCRRILHDSHAAEDVFQATFLVLADRAGAIRQRASLAGFLHGVAYRLAVRARARRRMHSLPGAVRDKAVGPAEELAWKEVLGILDHELGQLSDRYRAPLVLCYLEGRTQDEAARQLGWSLNTLRRRLARGRRLLEARLRGRGVTLPAALAGLLTASAVAVPGRLLAATLAVAGERAVEALTAGACLLSPARKAIAFLLSVSGKKVASVVAAAVLAAAVCFGYGLTTPADQAPPGDEPIPTAPKDGVERGGLAFDPLPAQGAVRLGTARYRHGTRIECLAVSADGRRAATSGGWRSFSPARVFDPTDGRCLYSLPDESGSDTEAVGLSPDGKTLAAKDDDFLYFLDAATGKELRKLKYLPDSAGSRSVTDWLTFTPDGKQVAATLMGHAVHLIDVATAKVIRTFAPGAAVSACVFSPDGKLMAAGGYEQEKGVYFARLWEADTGKELRRFTAGNGCIEALAFSPDGKTLAGGCWGDARLRLWEAATGKELKVFPRIGRQIQSVAFAPDGKTVAAAGDNVHLYDPVTGKERFRIDRQTRTLAFSRDGSVLTGAVSGAIYRWDAASGRQLTPAAAQDSAVQQILVTADGRKVFTTDEDGNLYTWDTAGGKSPRRIVGGVDRGVVASPDGRFLAWAVADDSVRTPDRAHPREIHIGSRVRLYDVAGRRVIDRFPGFEGDASVVAFLPSGKMLLTLGGATATVRLWDVESGKEGRSFPVSRKSDASDASVPYTNRRAALSPDGKKLAIGPNHWEGNIRDLDYGVPVRLWDVATGKAGHELEEPMNSLGESGMSALDRRKPSRQEARDLTRQQRELARQEAMDRARRQIELERWYTKEPSRGVFNRRLKSADGRAFSPDGRFLIDWAEDPYGRGNMDHVYVWDAATGRAVAILDYGRQVRARIAAFAPDGRTLATASVDGIVRLWEVATWAVRAEFRGHRDWVTALAFGPDGRLFTGGLDTVILGWDVRPPRGAAKGTLADAWEALADADGKAGFRAQGRFLAEPGKTIEWLAARLKPASRPDPSRVKGLIADLDNDDFATRERATAQLKEHWPVTAAALREVAAKSSSAEVRRRAGGILRGMEKTVTPPDELRALRAVEVLEWIGTPEARALLVELTKGAPTARLTLDAAAACRRVERR